MARNRLEIRLNVIRQNYITIKNAVSPLATMAVLKADAYGLGASAIRDALKLEGCDKFGVADVNEALSINDSKSDIYILGDLLPEEIPQVISHSFIAPVTSLKNATLLSQEASKQGKIVSCQILLDTGMGRLGIPIAKALEEIQQMRDLQNIQLRGIYSHFPHAYGDQDFSVEQINKLKDLLAELKQAGLDFEEVHIANSDGIHNIKEALSEPFNIARSGINLYGCFDLEGARTLELEQAVRLVSRLVSVRTLPAGSSIGYGRTYKLEKDTLIGTVAIGYADGLPISLSNSGSLIVRGVRCPIVGRVSMDYTTVDLSKVPSAEAGDEVVCLGDGIPVSDWAESSKTITYDIICSIGNRVERVYLEG
ncbi:MAG: alanine racemase [Lentisphaeraceae bacterium]|nr:alanine racemase [Lentisphaeraceae bacterium]